MSFADWSAPFGAALSIVGTNMAQIGLVEHAKYQSKMEAARTRTEDIKLALAMNGKIYDEKRGVVIDGKTGEETPLEPPTFGQMGQMGKTQDKKKEGSQGKLDFSKFGLDLGYKPQLDPIPGVLNGQ